MPPLTDGPHAGDPLTPEQKDRFTEVLEQAMGEMRTAPERERLAREEADFAAFLAVGFTREQADFLRKRFASMGHHHWDGMIGGNE